MKSILAIFILIGSVNASAKTLQQETCETLYPTEDLKICLQATEYPTFALLHDYMEMAKLSLKQGNSMRAIEFIEAAQTSIGIK